jgi:type I restriction enzyme S subunit
MVLFIESKAKGTSPTMKKISQAVVCAVPFPAAASLDCQVRKSLQLDNLLAAVSSVANISGTWQTEVNALVPALLGREFGHSSVRINGTGTLG